MDLSSGGDKEVGLDFVQVWPCHSRRGLKLPEATGSLPGQGEVLGLIMEHLKNQNSPCVLPVGPAGRKLVLKIRKVLEFILLSEVKQKWG